VTSTLLGVVSFLFLPSTIPSVVVHISTIGSRHHGNSTAKALSRDADQITRAMHQVSHKVHGTGFSSCHVQPDW
jgi:hypothetical protein